MSLLLVVGDTFSGGNWTPSIWKSLRRRPTTVVVPFQDLVGVRADNSNSSRLGALGDDQRVTAGAGHGAGDSGVDGRADRARCCCLCGVHEPQGRGQCRL